MAYVCPVCGYSDLPRPAVDYEICPSCGTEFEYTDARTSHDELRLRWILGEMRWHSRVKQPPLNWNPVEQLARNGLLALKAESTPASESKSASRPDLPESDLKVCFRGAAA